MSQTRSAVRWSGAIAAASLAAGAVLFGTAVPASANTNFNGSCETSEACVYYHGQHDGWVWDYEGSDSDFRNNYYPRSGPRLNDTGSSFENFGTRCVAVFANVPGNPANSTEFIRLAANGGFRDVYGTSLDNSASQLYWQC